MTITLDGTTGITTPGLTNTGTETLVNLTTTGNTTLGDASGDTLTVTGGTTTFTQGTANGVAYLNGSKVLTTGSALVFDGTNLGVGTSSPTAKLDAFQSSVGTYFLGGGGDNKARQLAIKSSTTTNSGDTHTFDAQSGTGILAFAIAGAEKARIDTSGNLLVGTTSTGYASSGSTYYSPAGQYWINNHLTGTSSGTRYIGFGIGTAEIGSITQNGTTSVNFNGYIVNPSDQKLKTNIVDAPSSLLLIDKIKIRSFDWIAEEKNQSYGVIAQELKTVFPEAVNSPINEDGFYGVDYTKLVPMLVKAIQEQQALITTLTDRITALENK